VAFLLARIPDPTALETADLPWFFPVLATWTDPLGTPHCRAIVLARLPDLRAREGEVSLAMPQTHAAACEESFTSYMASGLWANPLPDEEPRWYRQASFSVESPATGQQRVTVSYALDDDRPNQASYTTEGDSVHNAELLSYFGPGLAISGAVLSAPISLLLGIGVFFALGRRGASKQMPSQPPPEAAA